MKDSTARVCNGIDFPEYFIRNVSRFRLRACAVESSIWRSGNASGHGDKCSWTAVQNEVHYVGSETTP